MFNLASLEQHIKKTDHHKNPHLAKAIKSSSKVSHYLELVRKQLYSNNECSQFPIVKEINDAFEILEYKASQKNVRLRFIASKKLTLTGSPIRFHQVILNLVSNAIDAYDVESNEPKEVLVRVVKSASEIIVTVMDNGNGIPPEIHPQIFTPFFSTKKCDKGLGIGLAVCKEIVEQEFGGKIKAESRPKLTTFTLTIPNKS
jgi:C4-dicarboxylate-specific signal transduction histidine kinase